MQTISMSFDPDGSIEFTRNKNLDTFFGGAGKMRRVTDINKAEGWARFYITWLMGPYAGAAHTLEHHIDVFGPDYVAWDCELGLDNVLMFFSYEIAVQYEIKCLNAMREQGVTFDETTRT